VTGAASGIGKALAEKCIMEGMHVFLCDLNMAVIQNVANGMKKLAILPEQRILPFPMDCSSEKDNKLLLKAILDNFATVNLCFLNAGVGGGNGSNTVLGGDEEQWRWVEEVNFWGMWYGSRLFGNKMAELAKEDNSYEGHICNTASAAGYMTGALGAYSTSKHSVVALTETLLQDLYNRGVFPQVGASVLCPHVVKTNIFDQSKYQQSKTKKMVDSKYNQTKKMFFSAPGAIEPSVLANTVFESIRKQDLYINTHPDQTRELVFGRAKDIMYAQPRLERMKMGKIRYDIRQRVESGKNLKKLPVRSKL